MNLLKLKFHKHQVIFSPEYYFYYNELSTNSYPMDVSKFLHSNKYAKLCQRLKINYK